MTILVCLDGCSPEYLDYASTPVIDDLKERGHYTVGKAMVPTVTNVNNVSLVTASYPEAHGITSNYFIDQKTGKEVFMELADYLLAPTIFEKLKEKGGKTVLITAKDKLRTLIGREATLSFSLERPLSSVVKKVGQPPSIYSIEANLWLLRAARKVIFDQKPDFIFVSTTDFVPHKFSPREKEAKACFSEIDEILGEIIEHVPDLNVAITADHGMKRKTFALDLAEILRERGIESLCIPIIKDRYVVHHQNLGGAAYIYLKDLANRRKAISILEKQRGVERVLSRKGATRKYRLFFQRIGDIFVLADKKTVFGRLKKAVKINIRSHGSLYERQVPIVLCGEIFQKPVRYTKDVLLPLFHF